MTSGPDLNDAQVIYSHVFGPSHLDAFFDDTPRGNAWAWRAYRWTAIVFVFITYPVFITLHFVGIFATTDADLVQLASDISFLAHNTTNFFKMSYFITQRSIFKSLHLDFNRFKSAEHRPNFSKRILNKKTESLTKLTRVIYSISYINICFWVILPLTVSFISYIQYLLGKADPLPRYVPRFTRVRFPFDMSGQGYYLFATSQEFFQLLLGFIYFQPIDMFFLCSTNMLSAQYEIQRQSLLDLTTKLGTDSGKPIDGRDFVGDHQRLLKYGRKLRRVMNPVLGCSIVTNLVIMCTSTLVAADDTESNFLSSFANFLVIMTATSSFYMYTWMSHILKEAEESLFLSIYNTSWYERDVKFQKSLMIQIGRCRTARRIKIFEVGDIDRRTFVEGLKLIYSFYNFLVKFK